MSTEPGKSKLKEYAGGWITERKESEFPGFLKLAYPIIVVAILAYLVVYMNGEVTHEGRGHLVRAMNAATETSAVLMYAIAAMIVVFGVIVVAFAFGKSHD